MFSEFTICDGVTIAFMELRLSAVIAGSVEGHAVGIS